MMAKPHIPPTSYLAAGEIPSKWIVSVKALHKDDSPCLEGVHDIVNVLNTKWGCEEIEGATKTIPVGDAITLFAALRPMVPTEYCRVVATLALLQAHRECASDAEFEMVWGW